MSSAVRTACQPVDGSGGVQELQTAAGTQDNAASAASPQPANARESSLISGSSSPVETKRKSKKDTYTGPDTVVELPPTPMLDEEGKQRLDPDGKPMFNPPVRQQRDKHGHPLFDGDGKPVMQTATELGYDEHGKKLHPAKVKPPKMTPVSIRRGTLTVDGMTAKAALNYDIPDLKYIYLFAPGVGIAVVSNEPFPGATAQARAFDGKTLTVTVGEHSLEVQSDTLLLGKGAKPGYVLVDRRFTLPATSPVMGYGTTRVAPYAWPGAKANASLANVPSVPANMLPMQLLKPCPAGQMRRPAPKVLPGQPVPEQPCVAIATVKQSSAPAAKADAAKGPPATSVIAGGSGAGSPGLSNP